MNFPKMLAMGASGGAAGMGALYLFLVFGTRHVPNGGMDVIGWTIFTIAAAVPAAIFIGMHVAFANQLKAGASTLKP
jgi:hypothetical protein